MIIALILAAGRGERFSRGPVRKQFERINGVPMFIYAVRPYLDETIGAEVVLALDAANIAWAEEQLARYGMRERVKLTVGGKTRQESVRAAYHFACDTWQCHRKDSMLLHNAASPNVSVATIRKCIDGLQVAEMVQPYTPQLRTQMQLDADGIVGIPDRKSFGVNCDPTAYRAESLKRVIEHMETERLSGDSTIDLAFSLGLGIGTVVEDSSNIKVTSPWDLAAIREAMAEEVIQAIDNSDLPQTRLGRPDND